jgi:hypothetical protein
MSNIPPTKDTARASRCVDILISRLPKWLRTRTTDADRYRDCSCGAITNMPGLARTLAAERIRLDAERYIEGLL